MHLSSHTCFWLDWRDIRRSALRASRLVLLAFNDDALEFLENRELLVGRVNLGVTLLFAGQEANFFKPLQFALNVTRIFFYQLGEAANMSMEIRILSVNHYDFSAHSTSNKNV